MENQRPSVLYIVIPAYNESTNIRQTIRDWYPCVECFGGEGSRLVIIDDGSRDDTYKIMMEEQRTRPLFLPLTKENEGHGATIMYGYNFALEHGAEYILQTDSDGQTLPSEFEGFWQEREHYDMVIGQRCNRQDGIGRKCVSWFLKMVLRAVFHVKSKDANTPFRLMSATTLRKFIDKIPPKYHLSYVLITVLYEKSASRIKYIPISGLVAYNMCGIVF